MRINLRHNVSLFLENRHNNNVRYGVVSFLDGKIIINQLLIVTKLNHHGKNIISVDEYF